MKNRSTEPSRFNKKITSPYLDPHRLLFFLCRLALAMVITCLLTEWQSDLERGVLSTIRQWVWNPVQDAEYLTSTAVEPMMPKVPQPLPPPPPAPPPPQTAETIFAVTEQMPIFGNCDPEELSASEVRECSNQAIVAYLAKSLVYPKIPRGMCIQRNIIVVQFIIEKDGSITGEKIIRAIGPRFEEEALRVVRGMPRWKPGRQSGKEVRVRFNLPVRFRLE